MNERQRTAMDLRRRLDDAEREILDKVVPISRKLSEEYQRQSKVSSPGVDLRLQDVRDDFYAFRRRLHQHWQETDETIRKLGREDLRNGESDEDIISGSEAGIAAYPGFLQDLDQLDSRISALLDADSLLENSSESGNEQ